MSEKDETKRCPMKFSSAGYDACIKEKCAWWCAWLERCAATAIVSETSNILDIIRRRLEQ
jgi:hypothetical protein